MAFEMVYQKLKQRLCFQHESVVQGYFNYHHLVFEIFILVQTVHTKNRYCCLTLKTITTETIALKAVHSFKFEHVKFPRSCKEY